MEGCGQYRAVRPADWALCSQELLRWRSGRVRRSLGWRSGIAGSSSIAGRRGFSRRIGSRRRFRRGRRGFLSSRRSGLFLLTTAGAQHEGNRYGAPDLCIHRQLPQVCSVRS